ncbi:MAG: hypothetical protein ACYTGW_08195 [Planctomycetota bacterium]
MSNSTLTTRLMLCASLTAATTWAQPPTSALHGRVVTADTGKPLAGAQLTFQPEEGHDVILLQGWVGAGPAQAARTDERGRYRIPCRSAGCLLVQHSGFGALVHRTSPNTFRTVQARLMGELVLPGGAATVTHVLALSPGGQPTHLGPRTGRRIRLPEGAYQLLTRFDGRWFESRCRVISGQQQVLQAGPAQRRTLELYEGFRGRITPRGWPRVALSTSTGKVFVPDGPGPRILQVWEERQGCVLLHELWIQQQRQPLVPSSRPPRPARVRDARGNPVGGAWCFSCYRSPGGVHIVSRSKTDADGRARIADVASEPSGFLIVLKGGFALGHLELLGAEYPVSVLLEPGHPRRLLVLGPKGNPLPDVEVQLRPVAAPWAACRSFTDAKGELLLQDLPLGDARVRLLGTPFLIEEHKVQVTRAGKRAIIQARPGFKIKGHVVLPSGQPAANALVMVREPRGSRLLGEKVACTGAGGEFTFYGLPEELPLVLTASLEHAGRTWTSRALRVQAGTVNLQVKLLAEDRPQPGKRDKDR